MPPIVKDTAAPGSPVIANNDHRLLQMPAAYRPSGETGGRVQPVALEIPVAVNGSRTVEGSDTREPFSETTKTVLVFGNGAVIRLTAPVTAGQLLFLTNEKTKREVVCQVVKSKTYRNVSGYVEIEFTEPSAGFWGVRFPTDRIGPVRETATSPIPSSTPSASSPISLPSQQKPEPPSTGIQKPLESISAAPAVESLSSDSSLDSFPFAPPIVAPKISAINKPAAPPIHAPGQATKSLDELLAEITGISKVSANSTTPPLASPESNLNASALQQQLSSFLFAEQQNSASSSEDVSSKISQAPALPDSASNASAALAAAPEPKIEHLPQPSSRVPTDAHSQEIELPTWLMPKASAAQVTNRSTEVAAKLELAPLAPEPTTALESSSQAEDSVTGSFGTLSEGISGRNSQSAARTGNALWIGVAAAALVLSAAGYWYFQQTPSTIAAASTTHSPAPKASNPSPSDVDASSRTLTPPSAADTAPVKTEPAATGSASAKNPPPSGLAADAAILPLPPPISQSKAPSLGKLHLAAPVVQRKVLSQDNLQVPTLDGQPSAASMGANFAGAGGQPAAPAAPLAIGGNVTPARLFSSVQPAYSALAKSQHVSGDVKIDALIDANGRVTTMKILSGPPLLQQSAMDALRQWKYQPAMLNGNPVSMHLTVTLQFRLQ
jgi:TonB family protein